MRYTIFGFSVVLLAALFLTSNVKAQVLSPGSFEKTYARDYSIINEDCLQYINQLDAIQNHAPCLEEESVSSIGSTGLSLLSPRALVSYNSAYPRGYNDGPLWQGKGLTAALKGGIQGQWGVLSVTLNPMVYYSSNASFYIPSNPNKNEYSYPFQQNIDYVMRYGDDAFVKLLPGQSDVSVEAFNIRAGVSTQNFQWGPARHNPIVMSSHAPGFPHVYVGSDRPFDTGIGDIEIKQFWGQLSESSYFDDNSSNDERFITGLSLGYEPKWIPGLNLGFNRVMYENWQDLNWEDFFITAYRFETPSDVEAEAQNDEFDQIASVSARWTFPEVGFEPYFEFAKNDFGGEIWGFQPEHTRAFTLGITKWFELNNDRDLVLTAEHTTLGQSRSVLVRPTPTYYVHGVVKQGYTHQGQIMGAGIGPGSHSNTIDVKLYGPKLWHRLVIQNIRFDDDYYYATFDDRYHHDLEINATYEGRLQLDGYDIGYALTYSRRNNWYYERPRDLNNIHLTLSLSL
ncbi:capsule assembly Wzi family protein [Gracilimonas mengyeensis]|uniref:Capsule assembly protein Wzi n=1 Tax=Gracilimonas mengyeensis TaxID=1302730 RepID=A0A521FKF8_9BACT|nr:capsule assembly Wzi family protein [Gracilimonas mengyeensis]SMO96702.1 Capsule assembly protein Wzi [Gracilimonas mengyeensis]